DSLRMGREANVDWVPTTQGENMNRLGYFKGAALAAPLLWTSLTFGQFAVGTAFTYQGRLSDNGAPANGQYDLQFALYNWPSIGSPFAGPLTKEDVVVTNGLFTTTIDFGQPIPPGYACWMSIGVRPGPSTGAFTALAQRQQLTPAPIAASLAMPFNATALSAS